MRPSEGCDGGGDPISTLSVANFGSRQGAVLDTEPDEAGVFSKLSLFEKP